MELYGSVKKSAIKPIDLNDVEKTSDSFCHWMHLIRSGHHHVLDLFINDKIKINLIHKFTLEEAKYLIQIGCPKLATYLVNYMASMINS